MPRPSARLNCSLPGCDEIEPPIQYRHSELFAPHTLIQCAAPCFSHDTKVVRSLIGLISRITDFEFI